MRWTAISSSGARHPKDAVGDGLLPAPCNQGSGFPTCRAVPFPKPSPVVRGIVDLHEVVHALRGRLTRTESLRIDLLRDPIAASRGAR
jgi:hypothetical protein